MTNEEIKQARQAVYDSMCADYTLRIANALQYGKLVEARNLEREFDDRKERYEKENAVND